VRPLPPKLTALATALAGCDQPVRVADLARIVGVSRRTVFRELKELDALIEPDGLSVATLVGQGVQLIGAEWAKQALWQASAAGRASVPVGAHDRRVLFGLALLTSVDVQKLQTYANRYQVSTATLVHDLAWLDDELRPFGVTVERRPGFGVLVEGGEAAIRNAIAAAVSKLEAESDAVRLAAAYPPAEIVDGVAQLIRTRFAPQVDWMTPESRRGLTIFMAVAVERVISCGPLPSTDGGAPTTKLASADFFANSLELEFAVTIPEQERQALAVYLSALRQAAGAGAPSEAEAGSYLLTNLAYQMIEQFDPELAPFLKLDDRLVDGVAEHMRSAIVRIRNHVVLTDPLHAEMTREYPEVVAKARSALAVLGQIADDLPESEATFLATHFGAGLMRMQAHSNRRLRVAVVCGSGIGTSYLMDSQLREHFGSQADMEICVLGEAEDWARFDFCVASVPVENMSIPVVRVSPVLDSDDVRAVHAMITHLARPDVALASPSTMPLRQVCEDAGVVLASVEALLANFDVVTVDDCDDFDQLAKLVGYRFGHDQDGGRVIHADLVRREGLSTQVVPSLRLILLHTRTQGVDKPVFALIKPRSGQFTSAGLQQCCCCVVMLAPTQASRAALDVMGCLSAALLEDSAFLDAVVDGEEDAARRGVERHLREHLRNNIIF
ncbi:MAG: PRD domain-containing protein, partial [Propionibacteriaceae bacterium]|jgi:mannitol operon transcriptional antiterminator|nr:PRD domain-containing protein [Propionibacteriaceae bacterium]